MARENVKEWITLFLATHDVVSNREVSYVVDNIRADVGITKAPEYPGTRVRFEVDRDTPRRLEDVFADYTEDHEFSRSRIMVKLHAYGVRFVSRSEAKRLTHGLEQFREVVLDFKSVVGVGQGFVDEVFRVWANAHPTVRLTPVNMIEPVAFMVERGRPRK